MKFRLSLKTLFATLAAIVASGALFTGATLSASAQDYPYQAQRSGGYHDRDDQGGYGGRRLIGYVTYFNRFNLQIDTQNGRSIPIHLHQGTIINPTGTTLQDGMNVAISGTRNDDGTFEADRIDVVGGYGHRHH